MFVLNRTFPSLGLDPFAWDEFFRGVGPLAFSRNVERRAQDPRGSSARGPSTVVEEEDRFVVRFDVPGLSEQDVQVDLKDGRLTVTAERAVSPPEGYTALRRERSAFQLSRSFAVGDTIDPDKTTAQIQNGVLTVSIGKARAAQKKTISVKAA